MKPVLCGPRGPVRCGFPGAGHRIGPEPRMDLSFQVTREICSGETVPAVYILQFLAKQRGKGEQSVPLTKAQRLPLWNEV